jgi:hypothetical protein
MDLGVAGPVSAANSDPGVEKIRPGIAVILPRIYHLYVSGFPVAQASAVIKPVFPQPVEELFFHDRKNLKCSLSNLRTNREMYKHMKEELKMDNYPWII